MPDPKLPTPPGYGEPRTDSEARDAVHCHPDPALCACEGSGSYEAGLFAWHDCPHHGDDLTSEACGGDLPPARFESSGPPDRLPFARIDALALIRTCRVCGCTDDNCAGCVERTGEPCSWVAADLCSACALEAPMTVKINPIAPPGGVHRIRLELEPIRREHDRTSLPAALVKGVTS